MLKSVTFKFAVVKQIKEFLALLKNNILSSVGIKRAFCYSYRPRVLILFVLSLNLVQYVSADYTWWEHMPLAELTRMGLASNNKWKLCEVKQGTN